MFKNTFNCIQSFSNSTKLFSTKVISSKFNKTRWNTKLKSLGIPLAMMTSYYLFQSKFLFSEKRALLAEQIFKRLSLEGEYIDTLDIEEAVKILGKSDNASRAKDSIKRCIKGMRSSSYGYKWEFDTDQKIIILNSIKNFM